MINIVFRALFVLLLCVSAAALPSCEKRYVDVAIPPPKGYFGNLKYVFENNPATFSLFYGSLTAGGFGDTLSSPGPLTALAYTNNVLYVYSPASNYLLPGLVTVGQLRPGQTSFVQSLQGYRVFLDAWDSSGTTMYFANGVRLDATDRPANNGLVQQLNAQMAPLSYPNPSYYVKSDPALSLFAYALQRSRLDTLLQDSTKEYTVLVPTNTAMGNAGLDFNTVSHSDPDSLAENFIKYHILLGRNFMYKFKLSYDGDGINPDTLTVPTLSGLPMHVIVNPGGYISAQPVFMGDPSATAFVEFYDYFDIPAGKSITQRINNVLRPVTR